MCAYERYVCLISIVPSPSAGLGGVWRSEAGCYECVCCVCVLCVCVYMHMYVCLFVCLCVYECYVCMVIVVPALSAGLSGVWLSEAGSYECVCVLRVCIVCLCVHAYVCLFVCLCVYECYV